MAKRRETSLNYSTINDKNKLETITKKLLMYVLFLCLHMLHIRRNNNNTNILTNSCNRNGNKTKYVCSQQQSEANK